MSAVLVLSCEHAGRRVPARYRDALATEPGVLDTHEGWDPGALEMSRILARHTGAPLLATSVTRLVVDANRSPGHKRQFTRFTADLPEAERRSIVEKWHRPHWQAVEEAVRAAMDPRLPVLHVGVHTFTPVWKGVPRDVDVALLYDPSRPLEKHLADRWHRVLQRLLPDLRVRRNTPYRGAGDGLPTDLREMLPRARYLGFEIETSQAMVAAGRASEIAFALAASMDELGIRAPARAGISRRGRR